MPPPSMLRTVMRFPYVGGCSGSEEVDCSIPGINFMMNLLWSTTDSELVNAKREFDFGAGVWVGVSLMLEIAESIRGVCSFLNIGCASVGESSSASIGRNGERGIYRLFGSSSTSTHVETFKHVMQEHECSRKWRISFFFLIIYKIYEFRMR